MNYIKEFQKDNNLLADGIIGPITLLKMKEIFSLPSDEATAHFVGQLHHETAGFKYDKENLNYSVKGLLKVFKKYFPTEELAQKYARKPEKIANRVYANRMGNGPEHSGDGWSYRGRGSIQLTGKNNYREFGLFINDSNILSNPNKILPKHYWNVAVFFFRKNNLFRLTDVVDYNHIRRLTKRINGGYNGLQHRYDMTVKYYNILKTKKNNKNEKQNTNRDNNSTDSSDSDSVVSKTVSTESRVPSETRVKKRNYFWGFPPKGFRWLLPKTRR